MNRKFLVSTSILLFSIMALFFLWEQPVLLSALLLVTAYVKHRLSPITSELLWFSLICIGGTIVEILLVNMGGAWSYSSSQLFNIPIWMPLFWGVVGTTIVVMYDGLTEWRARSKTKIK
jgi:hypothetical protein